MIFVTLLVLCLPFIFSFSETFPSTEFNYTCNQVVTFDNSWTCTNSGGASYPLIQNVSKYNTKYGFNHYIQGCSSNCTNFLRHKPDDVFYFKNTSRISLFCADGKDDSNHGWLKFTNDDFTKGFTISLDNKNAGGDSSCNDFPTHINCVDTIEALCENSSLSHVNVTIQELMNDVGYEFGYNNLTDLTTIELGFRTDLGSQFGTIDDLNIGFLSGANTMPTGNFSISDNSCYNQTNTTSYLYINYSVSDSEGDTIYFGIIEDFETKLREVRYNTKNFWLSSQVDWSFLSKVYNQTGKCEINEYGYDSSKHNMILNSNNEFNFQINNDCTGDSEHIVRLDRVFSSLYFEQAIEDLENTEEFNLTFYASDFSQVFKSKFVNNNGNLSIYDYNSTDFNLIYNNKTNFDSLTIKFSDGMFFLDKNVTTTEINNELIRYVGIKTNAKIEQNYYKYIGLIPTITYTTSLQNEYEIKTTGYQRYRIYITDDVHLGSKLNLYIVDKYIDYCEYTIPTIDKGNYDTEFNFLPFFRDFLGNPMNEYFSAIGKTELVQSVLYWTFFLLILFLIFTGYQITHSINITFPLMVSSLSHIFMAYILDLPSHLIVFIIFFSISLIPLILPLFLGSDRQ